MSDTFPFIIEADLRHPIVTGERLSYFGKFKHFAPEPVFIEGNRGDFGLKIGYRLYAPDKDSILFEDRVEFPTVQIPPGVWMASEFKFPVSFSVGMEDRWLFVDIVQESKYWFSQYDQDGGYWFKLGPAGTDAQQKDRLANWAQEFSHDGEMLVRLLVKYTLGSILAKPCVVEVRPRGVSVPCLPLLPNVVPIELTAGNASECVKQLGKLEDQIDCLILRNILQYVSEFRLLLSVAFNRLATGGHLLVIVPSQYLYERKLQPPSRYNPMHLRFYSPCTLLSEIEEAIDPFEFRIRLLVDHDDDYRGSNSLSDEPAGNHAIVLCLERTSRPEWRDVLSNEEVPAFKARQATRIPELATGPREVPYLVVSPTAFSAHRILVLKLDHRGDFLMGDMAFRMLRSSFPEAHITLICGSWNVGPAQQDGLFDEVLAFNYFPEDASQGPMMMSADESDELFLNVLGDRAFDLALDLRLYEDTRGLLKLVKAENKAGFDPYDLYDWLSIRLAVPVPTRDGRAEIVRFLATDFYTDYGKHLGYAIDYKWQDEPSDDRTIVWGPYRDLLPGTYDVEVVISPIDGTVGPIAFDIAAEKGKLIACAGLLDLGVTTPRFRFVVPNKLESFEFRLYRTRDKNPPDFRFTGMVFNKQGAYIGVHQREAMALLVNLVTLRLSNPYVVTEITLGV